MLFRVTLTACMEKFLKNQK